MLLHKHFRTRYIHTAKADEALIILRRPRAPAPHMGADPSGRILSSRKKADLNVT